MKHTLRFLQILTIVTLLKSGILLGQNPQLARSVAKGVGFDWGTSSEVIKNSMPGAEVTYPRYNVSRLLIKRSELGNRWPRPDLFGAGVTELYFDVHDDEGLIGVSSRAPYDESVLADLTHRFGEVEEVKPFSQGFETLYRTHTWRSIAPGGFLRLQLARIPSFPTTKEVTCEIYISKLSEDRPVSSLDLFKAEKEAKVNAIEVMRKYENNPTYLPLKQESGLIHKTLKEGDSVHPQFTDKVTIHYVGKLSDGTVFDSSYERGAPITLTPKQTVKGFAQAMVMTDRGGKSFAILPPKLAYGAKGSPPKIPPHSVVTYEIEIIEIEKPEFTIEMIVPPEWSDELQKKVDSEKASPDEIYKLALIYEAGLGVAKSWKSANRYYHTAAKFGHGGADFQLGKHYAEGPDQDLKHAFEHFESGTLVGHVECHRETGIAYLKGLGVNVSKMQAQVQLGIAKELGDTEAAKLWPVW